MEVAKRTTRKGGLSGRMHHDPATINRILLSFRPIAPKPAASDGSEAGNARVTEAVKDLKRRPKRKYVRVNKISGDGSGSATGRKCKSKSTAGKVVEVDDSRRDLRFDVDVDGTGFFGFQGPDPRVTSSPEESGSGANGMMSFGFGIKNDSNPGLELGLGLGSVDRAVETWVVVSGVTAADGGGTAGMMVPDAERMRSLDLDTCPGMISDGLHRVQWVNRAYKAMVAGPAAAAEVAVRLVLKEDIPAGLSAFACTVRVVYTWRKEKYSKTMPCDVWKMEYGGFAWRLDTKAALCLGR